MPRLGPGGGALQVPADRHPRQVRVLLQGARHQPHEVRPRGKHAYIGLLVYWFICTIKQDILQITVLYHVGSPVDEPP